MEKLSFDKRRIKFLFLEGIHANATDALTRDGYTSVKNLAKSLTGDVLKAALKDVNGPAPAGPFAFARPAATDGS